jgi:hypothetical protein
MQSDKIIRKYKEMFQTLEEYDKTHELPFQRKRIDVTLSVRTINKLKKLSKQTGKPVSRIIEDRVLNCPKEDKSI